MPPKGALHFRTCLATESRLSNRVASTIEICTPLQLISYMSCEYIWALRQQATLCVFRKICLCAARATAADLQHQSSYSCVYLIFQ